MKTPVKLALLLVALSIFGVALWLSKQGTKPSSGPTETKVGALLSLIGDEANYGQWAKESIDLALEEINAKGGINGKPLRVVYEDDRSVNEVAVSALNKLIDVDKVFAVIGATRSGSTLAAAPVANRRQVVLITPTAGAPEIADAGDFIFRTRESGELQARVLARYVVNKLKLKRIAVLHPQEANAVGYVGPFVDEMSKLGEQVTSVAAFPKDQDDLRADIQKIASLKPAAIYVPGTAVQIARVLRQAKELGLQCQFLSSVGAENPELLTVAGQAAQGLLYSGMAFDPEDVDQRVASYVKDYTAKYGKPPNAWSANAFDAMMIVAAILRSGASDGLAIRDGLYALKDYHGVSGTITFDRRGEAIKPVAIKTVHNQSFTFLEMFK